MKTYRDIEGDGGSGVVRQITSQRKRIAERLGEIGSIVLIGSGKGGVGKSTVSAQLALSLVHSGKKAAILDADFNGPSVARMMGVRTAPFVPDRDGLRVPCTADNIQIASFGSLIPEGASLEFDALSTSDSHTWRSTKEFATLAEFLESVSWGKLDYLLVDLPPGPERTFQFAEFFGEAAYVVLVTIPSAVSYGVVSRSVAALGKSKTKMLGYIENMNRYLCPGCGGDFPLFQSPDHPSLPIPRLGAIPFDPLLATLCDGGLSIREWDKLRGSRMVNEIGEQLACRIKELK